MATGTGDGSTVLQDPVLQKSETSTVVAVRTVEKSLMPTTPMTKRERILSEPMNLKLEIEMATSPSQPSPLVTNTRHILPESVMVVDSQFVREIHFEFDGIAQEKNEDLTLLSGVYELYHTFGFIDVYESVYHRPVTVHIQGGRITTVPDVEVKTGVEGCVEGCVMAEDGVDGGVMVEGDVEVGVRNEGGVEVGVEDGVKYDKDTNIETQKSGSVGETVSSKPMWQEKYKIQSLSIENEALRKQVFEKNQQLKLANDRISQLQDTNIYRREVVRLEAVLEKHAEEKLKLTEDLERRNEEYKTVSSSVSDLLTQNTVLGEKRIN